MPRRFVRTLATPTQKPSARLRGLAAVGVLTTPTRLSSSTDRRSAGGHSRPRDVHHTAQGADRPFIPNARVEDNYPVVQLPARTLWCQPFPLDPKDLASGELDHMIARVHATRTYYQYPSMCAPQIGWNVRLFTLFDGRVFVNPVDVDAEDRAMAARSANMSVTAYDELAMARMRGEGKTCFTWEPCASCCFVMHYIERPRTVRIRALDAMGKPFEVTLDGMLARMALHEFDHMNGVLFTRRAVDASHVLPLDGFCSMSDWSDDYPSLEARSTFLYNIFTPPYSFEAYSVQDGNLLDRKYEDGVYPGWEHDRQMRIQNAAHDMLLRNRYRAEKRKGGVAPAEKMLPEGVDD